MMVNNVTRITGKTTTLYLPYKSLYYWCIKRTAHNHDSTFRAVISASYLILIYKLLFDDLHCVDSFCTFLFHHQYFSVTPATYDPQQFKLIQCHLLRVCSIGRLKCRNCCKQNILSITVKAGKSNLRISKYWNNDSC